MRPHGKANRRNRGHKGQDEDYYIGAHGEDMRTETYSHMQEMPHRNEGYRSSSTSMRTSYDTNREASTSRNQRSDTWRRRELDDVYVTNDGYHHHSRGGRGDHDVPETREAEGWSNRSQAEYRYPASRSEWYEQGYASSSYGESSSRTHPGSLHRDGRNASASYDPWIPEEPPTEHRHNFETDDRNLDRGYDRRREQHRDKGGQTFQSDSGWDTRRSRGWDHPPATREDALTSKDNVGSVERTWEPAPSWRSSQHSSNDQGHRNGHRGGHADRSSNATSKAGKRAMNQNKPKRDWRNDDGSSNALNNWTRRTTHDSSGRVVSSSDKTMKTPSRRKHYRSPSPSRSRSPAVSHHSHRSSWDRSRSRSISPVPKRQRREATPPFFPPSRTPSDRGRKQWVHPSHHEREPSTSPRRSPGHAAHSPTERGRSFWPNHSHQDQRSSLSPRRSPGGGFGRQRSVSSASSRSSKRSLSRSPSNRARAIHRLPPANAPGPISPNVPVHGTHTFRERGERKNGKHQQANGNAKRRKGAAAAQPNYNGSMPPPSIIPPVHNTLPLRSPHDNLPPRPVVYEREQLPHTPPIVRPEPVIPTPRFTPIKHPGFKPIGQTSSSLKKFFPSEEEDMDLASDDLPIVPTEEILTQSGASPPSCSQAQSQAPSMNGPTRENEKVVVTVTVEAAAPPKNVQTQPSSDLHRPPSPARERIHDQDGLMIPSVSLRGELYNIVAQVGEGTFGKVYKAQNTTTKLHVALKRIRMEAEKDGFPVTAMREIKLLQSLQHSNVVRLYEMMISNGSIYMVFEYMDHDLTGILSQTQFMFTDAHLKSLCHQMLAGLAYLHHKGVIHRDIKGSNILINNRGELKLADFGLARFYQKRRRMDYTNRVITLWYRPPELLFGATVYGPEVDMWSAGCIMLELFTRKPVFQGNDEIHQLEVIYKIIGTPTPECWAGIMDLPWYELIKPKEAIPNHFRELFRKWMSPAALDLAEQLLAYDPSQRATAIQAMDAPYFTQEQPRASLPVGLATLEGEWHELETKRERAKRRKRIENAV